MRLTPFCATYKPTRKLGIPGLVLFCDTTQSSTTSLGSFVGVSVFVLKWQDRELAISAYFASAADNAKINTVKKSFWQYLANSPGEIGQAE